MLSLICLELSRGQNEQVARIEETSNGPGDINSRLRHLRQYVNICRRCAKMIKRICKACHTT